AAPEEAARAVLGGVLSHGPVAVRIVEVEAYGGPAGSRYTVAAAHTWRGRTPRNEVMFGDAGHLYVYVSHGINQCANVTCRPEGEGGGVLLRAGRVEGGHDIVADWRPGVAGECVSAGRSGWTSGSGARTCSTRRRRSSSRRGASLTRTSGQGRGSGSRGNPTVPGGSGSPGRGRSRRTAVVPARRRSRTPAP